VPKKGKKQQVKRKPVGITFVLQSDYAAELVKVPKERCIRMLLAMKEALDYVQLKEYDVITLDSKEYYEKMKEKGIPEMWFHDSGINHISPHLDYYVVEFNDGSRKTIAMFPPEYEDEQPDPMFG